MAQTGQGPAPDGFTQVSAGYSDLDGAGTHRLAVESLAAEGVFEGTECGPGEFCPGDAVQRWVMAVWLVRILDGADPGPVSSSRFADVDADVWWAPYVERLADLDVTKGCSTEPVRFCPTETVTRARMASFLVRAFELSGGRSVRFTDTGGSVHGPNIDALAAAGVTAGCTTSGPPRYCPGRDTNRAEMATFLARALGLVEVPGASTQTPASTDHAIDAGREHTCAIRADDTIVCWGNNGWGQTNAPDGQYSAVTAGGRHTCGLRTDDTIVCWGNNRQGQSDAPNGQYSAVTAGDSHSCGVRIDDTIACWGNNGWGQTNAPDGQYSAVTAGSWHSCGLRIDDTIACWGNNDSGQSDAPDGQYSAVTAGSWHSCGLRTNGTVVCWGHNHSGESVPASRYSAVTAGNSHSCGLRIDDTIACWGNNNSGQSDAPDGQYNAVTVGESYSCGLRIDDTIACWGINDSGQSDAPDGQYNAVTAGREHTCGLRTDNTIACWGNNRQGQSNAPDGQYNAVTAGREHTCGLRIDDTIACWGINDSGQSDAPDGQYNAVTAGREHTCGLRTDNTIACWGINDSGQSDAPDGQYSAVTAGREHTCGLRIDNTVACWGNNGSGQSDAPDGQYNAVTAGESYSCGLRIDNTIACWGYNGGGLSDAPDGQYNAVAAGREHACGLRIDGTVVCWGYDGGLVDPPGGRFSAVSAGEGHTCALRTDAAVLCWGLAPIVAAPSGVQHVSRPDLAGPGMCRPYAEAGIDTTVGFPLPRWAPSAVGTVRVAVLFVDFADAAAALSTHDDAELDLPYAEEYLEAASYGRLDIEFVALHRWLRAEHNLDHYLDIDWLDIDAEAVRLADPDFDFTGHDIMMVVMPSTHFGGGNATGAAIARTQEGTISVTARINVFPGAQPVEFQWWGWIAAHELLHTLGLVDMYPLDASRREPPLDPNWSVTDFGPMGVRVYFPSARNEYLDAREMLAWSRWQLGWIDAEQIRCVTSAEATITLSPVASDPGDATAMAAVPLSHTEVIVIESRRQIGYDTELTTEGVLVYTVDAAIGSGLLPVKVAGDTGNRRIDRHPLLTVGQSVTVRGYTITVDSDNGTHHTVTITKNSNSEA